MPGSIFSPNLRIELIGTGEQSGTWGDTTNTNLGTLIEDAICGYETIAVNAANYPLTAIDGAADQSRNAILRLTTSTGAPFVVFAPPATKLYVVFNDTPYAATFCVATTIGAPGNVIPAGNNISIPSQKTAFIYSNGTNVYDALTFISDGLTVNTTLNVGGNASFGDNITVTELVTAKNATLAERLIAPVYNTAFATSTLSEPLIAGGNSVKLVDASGFANSGIIQIDSERMTYSSKSINTLDGVVRGQGGTADVAHVVNSVVTRFPGTTELTNLVVDGNISWNSASDSAVIGTGSVMRFIVDTLTTQSLSNKTLLGTTVSGQYKSNTTAISGTQVNCALGNYFTKSISTNTTFTIANVPSGVYSLTVELTTSSGASPTWWSNVYWPDNVTPTVSNGVHLFMFVTNNGGTIWHGAALTNYTA